MKNVFGKMIVVLFKIKKRQWTFYIVYKSRNLYCSTDFVLVNLDQFDKSWSHLERGTINQGVPSI